MTGYESVAGFLIGFTAACELRGYPSWLNRTLLNEHVATARRICKGEDVDDDELVARDEFAELMQNTIVALGKEADANRV